MIATELKRYVLTECGTTAEEAFCRARDLAQIDEDIHAYRLRDYPWKNVVETDSVQAGKDWTDENIYCITNKPKSEYTFVFWA